MKQILITNDDGFESKGLHALIEALKPLGNVTVVAPTVEKSACGHSLTLTQPLKFVELDDDFFKLDDGTPTDCIFLALNKLFNEEHKPDIIISGINKGANMGEDITYSGTVAGAMEAVLQGIPAIAVSQVCRDQCQNIDDFGYELAKDAIQTLVTKIFADDFPLEERKLLNVNIPPISKEESRGFCVTRAGKRIYGNDAQVHWNPRGIEHYWIGLPKLDWEHIPSEIMSDFEAIAQGYISVTPIHLDMTSHNDIAKVKKWL